MVVFKVVIQCATYGTKSLLSLVKYTLYVLFDFKTWTKSDFSIALVAQKSITLSILGEAYYDYDNYVEGNN